MVELVTTCRHCRHAGTHHGAESRAETWCQHCWHGARGEPELVWGGGSPSIHGVPWSAKSRQIEIAIPSRTGVIVLVARRYLGYIETIGGSFSHCKVPIVDPGNCPEFYCLTRGVQSKFQAGDLATATWSATCTSASTGHFRLVWWIVRLHEMREAS